MIKKTKLFAKACIVLLSVFLPITLSAQYYNSLFVSVEDLSEMTEPQLNLALEKSLKTIETGEAITIAGGVGTIIGGIMYFVGLNGITSGDYDDLSRNTNIALGGSVLASVGISAAGVGVTLWFLGNKRKDNIEIALVKFEPISYHDNSGYGVGINIPF